MPDSEHGIDTLVDTVWPDDPTVEPTPLQVALERAWALHLRDDHARQVETRRPNRWSGWSVQLAADVPQQILTESPQRSAATIVNLSTTDNVTLSSYIGNGSGFILQPGASLDINATSAVYAYSAASVTLNISTESYQ